jgi:4-hydroxy-3-methylbut-2-enyl diphosphate reductase IspH
MHRHWITRTIVAAGATAWMLSGALASEITNGQWAMERSERPGMVLFSMHSSRGGDHFNTTTDWPTNTFSGLDLAQDTQFTLTRDAGNFEFEGSLRNSAGGGTFKFSPDPRYAQEMKALGFNGVEGKQLHFAMHDVSLNFAREMKTANLQNLDTDKLLAFRIHGVSRKFIDELQAAGHNERNSDQLIAFRIHGVTPELVKRLRAAGYKPNSEMLVAMRIHGVTPEYMDELKQRGYEGVGLDQLVAFRIHGVQPDFIEELQKLGFEHPEPQQLVNLRIHGVTPEYIGEMQGRGVKNLTIDKLVAMKIHGLD